MGKKSLQARARVTFAMLQGKVSLLHINKGMGDVQDTNPPAVASILNCPPIT